MCVLPSFTPSTMTSEIMWHPHHHLGYRIPWSPFSGSILLSRMVSLRRTGTTDFGSGFGSCPQYAYCWIWMIFCCSSGELDCKNLSFTAFEKNRWQIKKVATLKNISLDSNIKVLRPMSLQNLLAYVQIVTALLSGFANFFSLLFHITLIM